MCLVSGKFSLENLVTQRVFDLDISDILYILHFF